MQTRRARAAEKAFVSLYRELYVAPDPLPALVAAASELQRLKALEETKATLEADVAGLDDELAKLKVVRCMRRVGCAPHRTRCACFLQNTHTSQNQDITIRDLEARLLSMEADIETQVVQRVKAREVRLLAAPAPLHFAQQY